MLALEVEFLTGTVVASRDDDPAQFDWPPQPDRIFSALVASWGIRGEDSDERAALEWLEQQEPPRILASTCQPRSAPGVFVPPNDFKTPSKLTPRAARASEGLDVLPVRRTRQLRQFPAGRPDDSVLRLVWAASPEPILRNRLDALARDTAYIGHSASLTRCRFVDDTFDLATSRAAARRIYPGRLAELVRRFRAGTRPAPGAAIFVSADQSTDVPKKTSIFSDRWIVLADDDNGHAPDMRVAPIVARKVRDALMGAYEGAIGPIPEWLSGHSADRAASRLPHLAVVPLLDVAWEHSEGRFMGCAIVVPRGVDTDALRPVIGALLEERSDSAPDIELHYAPGKVWRLRPTESPSLASLRPGRWTRTSQLWTTATPMVLDRFPKGRDAVEHALAVEEQIARACINIGLPKPVHVSASMSSGLNGSAAAAPRHDAPAWQRWQLPPKLAGRYLVHATLAFDEPIGGPVIVGAGRYVGLGLCLPFGPEVNR